MIKPLAVLFALSLGCIAQAQPVNIRVTNDFERDAEEVSIAVSQTNPDHIAIGANLRYLFTSSDGGDSWTPSQMSSQFGVWGDPALAFHGDTLYYAHLAGNIFGDSATWLNGMIIQKSSDMGLSWFSDVAIARTPPKQQDKPTLVDGSYYLNGIKHDRMLISWTQFDHYASHAPTDSSRLLASEEINAVWSESVRIDDTAGTCLDDDETDEGAVVASGRNGEVFAAWARHVYIYLDRTGGPALKFGREDILALQDSGWNIDIPGLPRANGFPTIACDTTINRVYIVWTQARDDRTTIYLRYYDVSQDRLSPIRAINEMSGGYAYHFYPSLAIDRTTGHLAILYYGSRGKASPAVDVFLARSHDHGETWSDERISTNAFTPNPFIFFGDYIQVAADHGFIYPAWMRVDSVSLSVWTAVIADSDVAGVEQKSATDDLHIEIGKSNQPSICFSLREDASVTITSTDALGRDVRTLVRGSYGEGRYRIPVSATHPNTVRFVQMATDRGGIHRSFVARYTE